MLEDPRETRRKQNESEREDLIRKDFIEFLIMFSVFLIFMLIIFLNRTPTP